VTEQRSCWAVGSEKGLCGGFNNSLFRTLAPWLEDATAAGRAVEVSFFGRRAAMVYRNRVPVVRRTYEAAHGRSGIRVGVARGA